jgi:hypothetical protein
VNDSGLELKTISQGAVPSAIARAEHYRLLNEPELAESICRDVLVVDPKNQKNLRVLILAITDQFASAGARVGKKEVLGLITELEGEFERCYYSGLVAEREGRACLTRSHAAQEAYHGFSDAMAWYEKADGLSPAGNEDAKLRYNTCLRTIQRERLQAPAPEPELPLE